MFRAIMKDFITHNLINRANKLNSRKVSSLDQNARDTIINITNFLPDDSPLKERMFCILHDIKDRQLCKFCGEPRRFILARNTYVQTCGSHVCSAKLREARKPHK